MPEPLVSVVMGTYNHSSFVAEAIRSVLTQDFENYEFLIADDGSVDNTPSVVSEFCDPRIRFQRHSINRGAAVVLNELVKQARGRYICVLNSDDAWMPGKLSEQIAILETRPEIGAVFGRAMFVDRDGERIGKGVLGFEGVFDQPNRTRGEWLRQFFWKGNCLCHPSVMIRRDIYAQAGFYDNRLKQLPDFDMWIRVFKVADIFVSKNTMVRFRIMPGENTSSDTLTNRVRTLNEHFFVALNFFKDISASLMKQGFGDCLRRQDLSTISALDVEAAFLFFRPVLTLDEVYKLVGMMKLRELLNSESSRKLLADHYEFDDRALHRLEAETMVLHHVPPDAGSMVSPSGISTDHRDSRIISQVPTWELAQTIRSRLMTRIRRLV